jgi:hypothetical protein
VPQIINPDELDLTPGGRNMGLGQATAGLIGTGLGAGAGLVGGKAERKAQERRYQQQRADIASAQGRLDEYGRQYADWQGQVPVEQLMGMAQGPSTSSSRSVTDINQLVSPETQAADMALTNMLRKQFEQSLGAPVMPGMEGELARQRGRQLSDLEGALADRAAMTGAGAQQSKLDALLAGRGIEAGYLSGLTNLPQQREQIMMARRGQAQGFLDPRLAQRTKGRTTTRGSSTSYSPAASISSILGILGTQAPQKPDIILPT